MKKIPVIAIVGATASGKTALAVDAARRFGGEVVSCDSMQIYAGMPVATAQPTEEERMGVPHHLIGFLPVNESYSVADYCRDASRIIEDISARGNVPVVCGGTGLYADCLLRDVELPYVETNESLRAQLGAEYDSDRQSLYDELMRVDPASAEKISIGDKKRVVRALEVYRLSGSPLSELNEKSRGREKPYDVLWLETRFADRQKLYDRINRRVDVMLENGLLDEARAFYESDFSSTAKAAIGYKELKPYLDGVQSLDECVESLKRATRRYAKRQLTWFSRHDDIVRIHPDEADASRTAFEIIRGFI